MRRPSEASSRNGAWASTRPSKRKRWRRRSACKRGTLNGRMRPLSEKKNRLSRATETEGAQSPAESATASAHRRAIRVWLWAAGALLVLLGVVGAAPLLTDSGLSIVEWRPCTAVLPPMSETTWAVEFDKYKASSEYELINKGMTLDEFKRIYWWEWAHRLLGRLI